MTVKRKRTATGGTRRVIRMGNSLGVTLPPEFTKAHHITAGQDLPFAANHLLKFIPMPEEEDEEVVKEVRKVTVKVRKCAPSLEHQLAVKLRELGEI